MNNATNTKTRKPAILAGAFALFAAAGGSGLAGGTHMGGHGSAPMHKGDHAKAMEEHHGKAGREHHVEAMDDHHGGMGTHAHDSWVAPPARYARMSSDRWGDPRSIARGARIYAAQCASCHGGAGRGNGPVADALEHPPANLTHHFHMAPGKGDGYLFWRVSKGGTVAPFNTSGSAMPAFEHILTGSQRWDVLAYVHEHIHRGFKMAGDEPDGDAPLALN